MTSDTMYIRANMTDPTKKLFGCWNLTQQSSLVKQEFYIVPLMRRIFELTIDCKSVPSVKSFMQIHTYMYCNLFSSTRVVYRGWKNRWKEGGSFSRSSSCSSRFRPFQSALGNNKKFTVKKSEICKKKSICDFSWFCHPQNMTKKLWSVVVIKAWKCEKIG